ncbi:proline racemase family protein [Psychromarinibacter sp. C21-152]|uniref:Proline racemase family protein n=1 Tax=Psychromarinibacter sediminicola TaxID=3033385 RepID=A0AAE3T7Y8_9RHOB|nr:proline racemase family protein [Psychromarinibacter sediminicola]MDF0600203.1 proline racemase family protein [Psychromarinibacter sediminicola]
MTYPDAIETVEMHTGGEPLRIVTAGWPEVKGATILDKRRYAAEHLDHLRRFIIHEPRGHDGMYAAVFVEPDLPGADLAVLFLHNAGYSTMCGHAVIALGRYAVDHGLVEARTPKTEVRMQLPCGRVTATVEVTRTGDGLRSGDVSFVSVPAFAEALDIDVPLPGHGTVRLDVAYGGAYYAILPAGRLGLDLRTTPLSVLVERAAAISAAVSGAVSLDHPDDPDLGFIYGTILTDGGTGRDGTSRNLCVFAGRQVDRCPTGSGVTARVALAAARGEASTGDSYLFQSVLGSEFTATLEALDSTGTSPVSRVRVAGRAAYCGTARFTREQGDELGRGFSLDRSHLAGTAAT